MTADLFGDPSPDQVCHELLLALAGRLPDELLWRLRDWLGAQGHAALAATLPSELLRHRVPLSERECGLLATAVGPWGASRRRVDAVLPVAVPDRPTVQFRPAPDVLDAAALGLLAVVRGHPGCAELWQAGRAALPGSSARPRPDQRVVVVRGGDRPWALAATLQRLLRAHGDRTPCVEVIDAHDAPGPYQDAALQVATPLWRAPSAVPAGA